jgi:hypothetical protein
MQNFHLTREEFEFEIEEMKLEYFIRPIAVIRGPCLHIVL